MIIYKGYYHFEKSGGRIIPSDVGRGSGALSVILRPELPQYIICVEKRDLLEEQVRAVLHELAHIGLEHDKFVREGYLANLFETTEINKLAEFEATRFYNKNPPLINKIREMIQTTNQKK